MARVLHARVDHPQGGVGVRATGLHVRTATLVPQVEGHLKVMELRMKPWMGGSSQGRRAWRQGLTHTREGWSMMGASDLTNMFGGLYPGPSIFIREVWVRPTLPRFL